MISMNDSYSSTNKRNGNTHSLLNDQPGLNKLHKLKKKNSMIAWNLLVITEMFF